MNLLMLTGDTTVAHDEGGAFSATLARFAAHWTRIDVLCPPTPGAQARTLYGKVHVHPSQQPKSTHPFFIVNKGRELIGERPYALITSHDFGIFYNGLGARRLSYLTGVPYVSEIHHVEGYPRAATPREQLYRAVATAYIPWANRRAAAFRAVNRDEIPNLLRRLGVPDEKILVLPSLYIDFDLFRPQPDVPKTVDMAFVGRFAPNKGLFTLLNAVAQVKTTHPQVRLALLGRGALQKALEARIAALGLGSNVVLITERVSPEGVAHFYNAARMLVCASTAEGGPRFTVEAMACGIPVISTPVGVMRDLIHDGENGLLFRWDVESLAAHIRRLLDDVALRARLGEAGRASVQGFEAERVVAAYAQGYHDLIARLGR
jgi:glycosyltransferase involved in cell wall biosynthesis